MTAGASRRKYFAPEVVQTSAMDCGPACLKSLLEGWGTPVSYGRLREACQTDVDGTSIDTLEEIACQLGLDATQTMLPADRMLLPEAEALPALVVIRAPSGFTHFVVVWRRHGPLVQVMDPAVGRRWMTHTHFLNDLYIHELPIPVANWHEWARSPDFLRPLGRSLSSLGVEPEPLVADATQSSDWRDLAALDAAVRLASSLVRAGGVRRGRPARALLPSLFDAARRTAKGEEASIPEVYFSARPVRPAANSGAVSRGGGEDVDLQAEGGDADDGEKLILRGAILLQVHGRSEPSEATSADDNTAADVTTATTSTTTTTTAPPVDDGAGEGDVTSALPPLSPDLADALAEPPSRPGRELLRLLRGDGAGSHLLLAGAIIIAAASVIVEAVVLRGAIDVAEQLGLVTQRLQASIYFLIFCLAMLCVELPLAGALLRLGRRLESNLRRKFLTKIPRLTDRYFQSRPISDMAERGHSTQRLREAPRLGGQFLRAGFSLLFTALALIWVFPGGAPIALVAAALAVGIPLALKPQLEEVDLRVRTHSGALSRFYLDVLLGLAAVRAHGAERAVGREHESLVVEWAGAASRLVNWSVILEGLQALAGFGLAAWLLLLYAHDVGEPAGALLVAYWALYLPVLGEEIALVVRQYPTYRNLALRLFEPLGARDSESDRNLRDSEPALREEGRRSSVRVNLESVTVVAAGHTILSDIDLAVEPGSHVAIVGASGAGKSSLVGLLLGWHRAAAGRVLVDGEALDPEHLRSLQRETVWVDPAVQLWNRSLLRNLNYGLYDGDVLPVGQVLSEADLHGVVEQLPQGLQTALGEGGGLVSGGEGQRVRVGRGLARARPRLVILDEPFRGLDRARRREFLERVRGRWHDATLFCITHDVSETQSFDRVLVIHEGRVAEQGAPRELLSDASSRYAQLVATENTVSDEVWSSDDWRRLRLESGCLREVRRGEEGS